MKNIFSVIFLFSLNSTLLAAPSGIKGTIVDVGNQIRLEFVNVALFLKDSGKLVKGTITDKKGLFVFSSIDEGKYIIRVSFVGYKTFKQELTLNGTPLDLGQIKLEGNSKKLSDVEIIGQGSQMHFDIDKKVYSVDQNIAAAGGSASDVLKDIPSVTVDEQGNITLRKDANVEVWINGKASGLNADNRAQVLEQMPADNIESIEVMTNPSAKYNPEGSAGIINIVMKNEHKAGYYGSVSAGITYPDRGKPGKHTGASISYSSSKMYAYVNMGYRAKTIQGGKKTERINYMGSDTTLLIQNGTTSNTNSGLFMRAGIDYRLNKKNTLSFSGFGMSGSGKQSSFTHSVLSEDLYNASFPLKDYDQINSGNSIHPSLDLNVDYKHVFNKKKDNTIIASFSFSNHNRSLNSIYEKLLADSTIKTDITQNTDNKNTEFELKVDYTNRLTKNSKLEAGWESKINNRINGSSGIDNSDNSSLPAYFDEFKYDDQTHAGYVTYGNQMHKLIYQVGLRAEYFTRQFSDTTISANETDKSIQVYNSHPIFHVYPSFYLSYSLPRNAELQFNYTSRVNRHRGKKIDPYRDYSDPNNISYGNPYLFPQYSSAMELNYIKSWDAQILSASLYYHNTDNETENVRYVYQGVMYNTYLNIAKSQKAGLELISKNRLFRILNLTTTINMYYNKLDSASFTDPYNQYNSIGQSSDLSWSGSVLANFMLTRTFSGQITAKYDSPQIISQGTENEKYTIEIGFRKTFLDRKLSVNLTVRDLLNSNRNRTTTSGSGFYQNALTYSHGRMVGLSVSYNFGNKNPKQSELKKQEVSPDEIDNEE
jgi:hypothetical protein